MAVFEYLCKICSVVFERTFGIGKAPQEEECPKCKKMAQKIISSPLFTVKGANAANGYSGKSNSDGRGHGSEL